MEASPATGRSYVLLVNPSAGGGRSRDRLPAAEAAIRAAALRHRTVMTRDLADAVAEAEAAAAGGEIPVVMSGDGMLGKVGGVLAGTDTPLGLIPGGRGNDFARVVGIPTDPAEAVAVLAADNRRRIDVGEANGERFLCIASCGFDSDANRIANEAKLIRGPLVYAYAAIKALLLWKPANFTLTVDGESRTLTGYSVAAANSKAYGGGMFVAPDAELDDGLLDIVTTSQVSKLRFASGLRKVFKGTHIEQNDEVDHFRAREVKIEADRPFAVYADGEHITDLPATVSLKASSLDVIAPPAAS